MTTLNKSGAVTQLETLISGLTLATETTNNLVLILKSAELANVDSSTIKTELLSRIASVDNTSSIEELVILSAALPLITGNREVSVADLTELNALSVEPGTVVFVDSEEIPYVYKSNETWEMIFSSLQGAKPTVNLYGWGYNTKGQLGDGTTANKSSPVSVLGGFTDWVQASSGSYHSLGIRANGSAWAWGNNGSGRLGDNTTTSRSSPVSVVGEFTDWIQLSAGYNHSLGLRANGTAWAWGFAGSGKLGDNTLDTTTSSPVSVVGGFTDWIQVSAGQDHSLGLRANGTAWAWGNAASGNLGDGTTANKSSPVSVVGNFTDWTQVSAGREHSLGLRANGTAWAWGSNGSGRLGDNTSTNASSPVSVVGGFTDWIQVDAGRLHSIGVRTNGSAWAWGNNGSGRLGNNNTTNASSPVAVVGGFADWVQASAGDNHSLGLRANGSAWAWGDNYFGTLGDNTNTNTSSPVSVVGGFTDWIQVSAGGHSLGVKAG